MGGAPGRGGARARQPAVGRGLQPPEPRPHRARRAPGPAPRVVPRRGLARHRAALGVAAARALRPARRRAAARAARGHGQRGVPVAPAAAARGRAQGGDRGRGGGDGPGGGPAARRSHGRGGGARSWPTWAGHDLASILEAYEEAGRKRSGPVRDPGRHDQGLGLSLRRRSHEPQRAGHPGPARRDARHARPRVRRGVGRLRAGQRRGGADPPRARAVRAARAPARRGARRPRRAGGVLSRRRARRRKRSAASSAG